MQASEHSFSYVGNTTDIISELKHSKEHGNVLGICAISLGPNMIMAAVDEMMEIKKDLLIFLKETDPLGMKLPEDQIFLSEIVRVHPFRTKFDDPFHVKLRELRTREASENVSA